MTCAHCYSSSSPSARGELGVDALLGALAVLGDEGFGVVSLSGGEPFLYRGLRSLVDGVTALGYSVNVVTNATVLTARRLSEVAHHLAFVAVSLDGVRDRHDLIRGRQGAFDDALRGLQLVREAGVPFGLTCCVTADNLVDVPELYGIAVDSGARLLNLRPLALVGRGNDLGDAGLNPADLARLVLVADLLGGDPDSEVGVRVDLAPAGALREQAGAAHALLRDGADMLRLSDLVNPLIVDEQGRLLPFAYGVHPRFAITQGLERVADDVAAWKTNGVARLRDLLERAVDALPDAAEAPVDWFDHLARTSHAGVAVGAPVPR
ncbi:MAG: radical SAM protein [Actinomycetota bacterium]|nr:radical SAM protein [Euzebyaceae bacterium]MDQ3451592.1 radical SAM protein [Actinomycetota bacterium]